MAPDCETSASGPGRAMFLLKVAFRRTRIHQSQTIGAEYTHAVATADLKHCLFTLHAFRSPFTETRRDNNRCPDTTFTALPDDVLDGNGRSGYDGQINRSLDGRQG